MSLRLQQVGVRRRGRALLEAIELEVGSAEFLALLGPNGAGKTTLLRSAAGLVSPDTGRVLLDGRDVSSFSARERAARVAWLPQHGSTTEALSALEVVTAARFRFDESFAIAAAQANKALARVGSADASQRSILTLSGGERQRVALAALLAQATPLLLLDEPANHLDPAQQIDVYRLLGELWREGLSIVCVTHDVNLLRHLGASEKVRVAGLQNGTLRFQTTFDAPELPDQLGQLFGIGMRALALDGSRVLVAEGRS